MRSWRSRRQGPMSASASAKGLSATSHLRCPSIVESTGKSIAPHSRTPAGRSPYEADGDIAASSLRVVCPRQRTIDNIGDPESPQTAALATEQPAPRRGNFAAVLPNANALAMLTLRWLVGTHCPDDRRVESRLGLEGRGRRPPRQRSPFATSSALHPMLATHTMQLLLSTSDRGHSNHPKSR